jgi:sulfur carrier protein
MQVFINQISHELPTGATLQTAITLVNAQAPFATAVNLVFVPNSQYEQKILQAQDRIDIISPVTGG